MDFYKRLAPVVAKPSPCAGVARSLLSISGGTVYTHIAGQPIDELKDDIVAGGQATFGGKPGGFWFAPDRVWVDLMAQKGTWNITAPLLGAEGQTRRPYIAEAYACVVDRECPPAEGKTLQVPPMNPHFVYRFSLAADAFVAKLNEPAKNKVFRLTAENEAEWLAEFDRWAESVASQKARVVSEYIRRTGVREGDPRAKNLKTNRLLADFYTEVMVGKWGGIYFDGSLFAGAIEPGSWKANLEVESGCLWAPLTVLGAPGCIAPNAVIAFAGSKEDADRRAAEPLIAPYADRLFLAGITTDDHVAFFKTPKVGGRRGRTFRRKPVRRNKYGSRLARKSQRRLQRDRHA
jgi:hypothetical protein